MSGRYSLSARCGSVPCGRLPRPRRVSSSRVRASEEPREPLKKETSDKPSFGLDELGPVRLGRKSRQAFDELWTQFAGLASPTKSFSDSDFYQDAVFSVDPEAPNTRVLVLGAAGRTGRIVLRKLLLRGYRVRVMLRDEKAVEEMLSSRVECVIGDILDQKKCQEAMKGVNKVVFAAAPKDMDPEAYRSVFQAGLKNILHAFMDEKWKRSKKENARPKQVLADFKRSDVMDEWNATVLGRVSRFDGEDEERIPTRSVINGVKQWTSRQNSFIIKSTKARNLQFRGAVNEIGCSAEVGGSVSPEVAASAEGVILRVRGDGNVYAVICTMDDGRKFAARFVTKWGYSTVRIPFTLFRPDWGGSDPVDGSRIVKMGFRFENRGKPLTSQDGTYEQPSGRFNLEVDWIKTIPSGKTTDFVLISCAGVPRKGVSVNTLKEILICQRTGEAIVRNSGVGYTIVRPTTLIDEPGGLKALVFDQGERVTQSISAVDVADVGVRALPQSLAANKTFEVAHEASSTEEENEAYELVAHVPDKSTNYLGAALANLQKNT